MMTTGSTDFSRFAHHFAGKTTLCDRQWLCLKAAYRFSYYATLRKDTPPDVLAKLIEIMDSTDVQAPDHHSLKDVRKLQKANRDISMSAALSDAEI